MSRFQFGYIERDQIGSDAEFIGRPERSCVFAGQVVKQARYVIHRARVVAVDVGLGHAAASRAFLPKPHSSTLEPLIS